MSPLAAMLTGALRAAASPVILVGLWLVNVAVAAPAAYVVMQALEDDIGRSETGRTLLEGFDMDWFSRFDEASSGVASTFTPTLSGAGAIYDNVERMLTGRHGAPFPLLALGAVYVLIRGFLLGGVLDRFADRTTRAGIARFFGSGARYFLRLVRLAGLSALLYFGIYRLCRSMFEWMESATLDVTVESTMLYYSVLIWGLTAGLLTLVHATFGFAKAATVVDGRRSMLLAAVRGFVFMMTHPVRTLGLYYGFLLVSGLFLAGYALVAPGVGQRTAEAIVGSLVAGQAFLLFRLYLRLSLLAGQVALYQAHGARRSATPFDRVEPVPSAPMPPAGATPGP